MKKCKKCGKKTKNPDKKGNCPECSKKRLDWDDCICGMTNVHTIECKQNHRKNYLHYHSTVIRKALRKERFEKHLCASCGDKVKPKIIYPYRCDCCQKKIREYNKKRKNGNR